MVLARGVTDCKRPAAFACYSQWWWAGPGWRNRCVKHSDEFSGKDCRELTPADRKMIPARRRRRKAA